jgi:type IV secretory pathway TrbF-like protein
MIDYQKAQEEWSSRIGTAKSQAKHWQIACFFSLLLAILLVVAIVILMNIQKTYVYVAEVKPQENIVNVKPADIPYVASEAQEEYFIAKFIRSMMSLSLDPVVVRNQWFQSYRWVDSRAIEQLNEYARKVNPFADMGRMTKVVKIRTFHPIGNHSFDFSWNVITYDMKGNVQQTEAYNGIFTLIQGASPSDTETLLENPLGLKIVYFAFSPQGKS